MKLPKNFELNLISFLIILEFLLLFVPDLTIMKEYWKSKQLI